MTTIRDRCEDHDEEWLNDKAPEWTHRFNSLPKGYEPDDNDPAWPSKSGQAD